MKKLILILAIILIPAVAMAWSLTCDPVEGAVAFDVEIDGVVIAVVAEPDGSFIYNIDGLGAGPHVFRAMAYSADGWGSEWSDPFGASRPGTPSLKIVR